MDAKVAQLGTKFPSSNGNLTSSTAFTKACHQVPILIHMSPIHTIPPYLRRSIFDL